MNQRFNPLSVNIRTNQVRRIQRWSPMKDRDPSPEAQSLLSIRLPRWRERLSRRAGRTDGP